MKTIVLDTNVLLDIFVFNDFRTLHLKQALQEKHFDAVVTQKTLAEFAEVIARPLFALEPNLQSNLCSKWISLSRLVVDESLCAAPWQCEDPDDQVFINLAYTVKPAILISKDHALLKLAKAASAQDIFITADYTYTDFYLKIS
jgi:putative PIN family toxin of toxin-antitoxin system